MGLNSYFTSLAKYLEKDNGYIILTEAYVVVIGVKVFDFLHEDIFDSGDGFCTIFHNDVIEIGVVEREKVFNTVGVNDDSVVFLETNFVVAVGEAALKACRRGFFYAKETDFVLGIEANGKRNSAAGIVKLPVFNIQDAHVDGHEGHSGHFKAGESFVEHLKKAIGKNNFLRHDVFSESGVHIFHKDGEHGRRNTMACHIGHKDQVIGFSAYDYFFDVEEISAQFLAWLEKVLITYHLGEGSGIGEKFVLQGFGRIEVIKHLSGDGSKFLFVELDIRNIDKGNDATVIGIVYKDGEGTDVVPSLFELDFGMLFEGAGGDGFV
jgi:hypothetical protein